MEPVESGGVSFIHERTKGFERPAVTWRNKLVRVFSKKRFDLRDRKDLLRLANRVKTLTSRMADPLAQKKLGSLFHVLKEMPHLLEDKQVAKIFSTVVEKLAVRAKEQITDRKSALVYAELMAHFLLAQKKEVEEDEFLGLFQSKLLEFEQQGVELQDPELSEDMVKTCFQVMREPVDLKESFENSVIRIAIEKLDREAVALEELKTENIPGAPFYAQQLQSIHREYDRLKGGYPRDADIAKNFFASVHKRYVNALVQEFRSMEQIDSSELNPEQKNQAKAILERRWLDHMKNLTAMLSFQERAAIYQEVEVGLQAAESSVHALHPEFVKALPLEVNLFCLGIAEDKSQLAFLTQAARVFFLPESSRTTEQFNAVMKELKQNPGYLTSLVELIQFQSSAVIDGESAQAILKQLESILRSLQPEDALSACPELDAKATTLIGEIVGSMVAQLTREGLSEGVDALFSSILRLWSVYPENYSFRGIKFSCFKALATLLPEKEYLSLMLQWLQKVKRSAEEAVETKISDSSQPLWYVKEAFMTGMSDPRILSHPEFKKMQEDFMKSFGEAVLDRPFSIFRGLSRDCYSKKAPPDSATEEEKKWAAQCPFIELLSSTFGRGHVLFEHESEERVFVQDEAPDLIMRAYRSLQPIVEKYVSSFYPAQKVSPEQRARVQKYVESAILSQTLEMSFGTIVTETYASGGKMLRVIPNQDLLDRVAKKYFEKSVDQLASYEKACVFHYVRGLSSGQRPILSFEEIKEQIPAEVKEEDLPEITSDVILHLDYQQTPPACIVRNSFVYALYSKTEELDLFEKQLLWVNTSIVIPFDPDKDPESPLTWEQKISVKDMTQDVGLKTL